MTRNLALKLILATTVALQTAACDDDDPVPTPADAAKPADGATTDAAGSGAETGSPDAGTGAIDVGADPDATADGGTPSALVQRGDYLVNAVIACGDCHTPRLEGGKFDTTKFLAGDTTPAPMCLFFNPTSGECLHARNLTNDVTGLKNRTDDEIKTMFMKGLRPAATGGGQPTPLHPVMPYYVFANMTDADADAIVAYLRTVPAVSNTIPAPGDSWKVPAPVAKLNVANVPKPLPTYPQQTQALHGQYLATQTGLCVECHSKHLMPGPGVATVLDETKILQGGEDFTGILGPTLPIVSKNLTPDPTTGLGNWTIDEVVKAVVMGKDKMDKGICPPMPTGPMSAYSKLTPSDAADIAHYLKSITPAVNMIEDKCTFPPGP
jgi:mono/diheme cytochrome c family protein